MLKTVNTQSTTIFLGNVFLMESLYHNVSAATMSLKLKLNVLLGINIVTKKVRKKLRGVKYEYDGTFFKRICHHVQSVIIQS